MYEADFNYFETKNLRKLTKTREAALNFYRIERNYIMLKKLTLSAGIFCFIIAASAESTLLQHDFANGWQKMDKEKFARKIQKNSSESKVAAE